MYVFEYVCVQNNIWNVRFVCFVLHTEQDWFSFLIRIVPVYQEATKFMINLHTDLRQLLWDQYSFNSRYMYLARGTQGCYLLQQDPEVAKSLEGKWKHFLKCEIETEWEVYHLPRFRSAICNDILLNKKKLWTV